MTYELCDTSVPIGDQIAFASYFEVMIHNKAGEEALKREAETHFCPELTKFLFDDHPTWLAMCAREKPRALTTLYSVQEDREDSGDRDRDKESRDKESRDHASPVSTLLELSQTSYLRDSFDLSKLGTDTEISVQPFEPKIDDEKAIRINKFANYLYRAYIEKIGRAVQQECRDRSRMPSSA
eukprot:TRINITY_DN6900_c0_g1_i18.p1 TRINITY_DN6900_c0_g1~~TRINITY_DN6900_c0_g1_i18.p1  ORF type:complete len:182 (+),score=14.94 TRINITY_DN6900_c0_g1_i18:126-671(+)